MRTKHTAQISLDACLHFWANLKLYITNFKKLVIYICFQFYLKHIVHLFMAWNDIMSISKLYKSIAVAHHKAIKRIYGLNKWDGNHLACERLNVSIIEHLLAKRIVNFFYRRTISSSSTRSIKFLSVSLRFSTLRIFHWNRSKTEGRWSAYL